MAHLGNTVVNGNLKILNGVQGDGSGLTALNASNIASGTLAKERLATSGATAGSYGLSANATPAFGATFNVPYVTVDTYGRTTAASTKTVKIPDTAATQSVAGLMSAADKKKLDGVATSANAYTHPTAGANTGSFGPSANATPGFGDTFNVPYVTVNSDGHTTAASTKTVKIPNTAATSSALGLVKIGSNITVSSGTISLTKANVTTALGYTPPTTNTTYSTGTTAQLIAGTDTTDRVYTPKAISDYVRPRSIEFIKTTNTAAGGALTGVTEDAALYDGKTIFLYLSYAAGSNASLNLTLADGTTTTGAKAIYWTGTARLTTHYAVGSVLSLTYVEAKDAWCRADYDTNSQGQYLYNYNTSYFKSAVVAESLAVGDSSGYAQAASGVTFDIAYPIIWVTGAKAAGGTGYSDTFLMHYDRSLANVKSTFSGTAKNMVYLVVTLSGNTATIDDTVITDVIPTTADGKIYIALGRLGNQSTGKNYFILYPAHPMFYYNNGAFRPYHFTTAAAGTSNGQVKINGTDVTVYTHPSYTARTGKPTANATPGFGDTFTISQITSDATGHVTAATDRTVKIPATAATSSALGLVKIGSNITVSSGTISLTKANVTAALGYTPPTADNDTKNTTGSTDTSSKIFLVGATSQAANPQTYSHDTVFVDTNGRVNSAAPASDANDTTVATTKWVKDQSYITSSANITGTAANVTGTVAMANGGTGKTNGKDAANALINSLDTGSSTPVDADYYISQYVSGGTSTTTYHRRPMSALYAYVKGKTDTVYAPKASPALTGTPTAPTAAATTNSTQIATTAYVKSNVPASVGSASVPVYTDSNGKITVCTSLDATKLSGTIPAACYTNTDTKVTATKTALPSSATSYYLVGSSSEATATEGVVKFGYDARFYMQAGTTSAEGKAQICLGNTTASGTAGNSTGGITLYNNKGKYAHIQPHPGDTTDRVMYTPKTGGTLVAHTTDTKIGDTNKPVYITADGVATAISYTIATSVPSGAVFTDTKNTAGSTNSTSKLFLTGATSQAANPQTYSHSSVYETNGVLNATSYSVNGHGSIQYNSTTGCIEILCA